MKTFNDLCNALNELGFGIKVKDTATPKTANYYHLETEEPLSYKAYSSKELIVQWKPLFDFINQNWDAIYEISNQEDIRGLYTR